MMAHSILEITPTLSDRIDFTNKTNQEVGQIIEWFLLDWPYKMPEELTTAQQNQWKLEQAHKKMLKMVVMVAGANRLEQRRRAEIGNLKQQVEDEVALIQE
jgi:hypothetical protein